VSRLPIPGQDDGTWGNILNDYLSVVHNGDGTLRNSSVATAQLQNNCVTNVQLDPSTQAILASVASKYVKPSGGIPSSDLSSGVQASLTSASTAVQNVNGKTGTSITLAASDVSALPTTTKLAGLADTSGASSATDNQVLSFNSGTNQWVASTVTSTTVSDATIGSKGIVQLAGDLGGTAASPTVLKASGLRSATTAIDVSTATAPSSGQVLTASSGTAASWQTPASGVVLDTTASDIAPLGTQSAGSIGKAADAGHVHPTTGLLLTANNLSDVSDAGISRQSLHVPILLPVACVAASNVSSLSGLNTYDGYTLTAGDQVLLIGQTTASQNGPWVAASGAWTRPTDFATGNSVKARSIQVIQGTTYGGSAFLLQTNSSITVDTTAQTWVNQLPSSVVSAGLGLAFTGTVIGGAGDNLNMLEPVGSTTGQLLQMLNGTSATPETSLSPLVKAARTLTLSASAIPGGGDGGENASAIHGITAGSAANQVQTVGVIGGATNKGTAKGVSGSPDACGVYGVGRILGTGALGVAMGAFFRGQADVTNGLITGMQVQAYNNTGRDDSVLTNGFSSSAIQWIWPAGPNRVGAGIEFGNPGGQQVDVGIHFTGQVNGGFTGAIRTADILSNSTAATGIRLAGTYSSAALSVVQGSGPVVLGAASSAFSSAALDVVNSGNADPLLAVRSTSTNGAVSIRIQNGTNGGRYFVSGSAGNFLSDTANGDTGFQIGTGSAMRFGFSGANSKMSINTNGVGIASNPVAGSELISVASVDTQIPIIVQAHSATQGSALFQAQNSSGADLFHIGATGNIVPKDGGNIVIGTSTGTQIGTAATQKIGLWGKTPVVQQATTGTSTGFTAGGGTGMTSTSTSTGGTGASAYTFGDLVLALKNLGVLAA